MPEKGLGGVVDFRLLGPVELWVAGRRIELGHARQRCVLAVLLIEAGQVVPAWTLIDRVWGHEPPDGGLNVLYAYVNRLRKALATVGVSLPRRSGGYLLDIDRETVDVYRFQRLIAAAEGTAGAAVAIGSLDAALALWRGTPFADPTRARLGKVPEGLPGPRPVPGVARHDGAVRAGRGR